MCINTVVASDGLLQTYLQSHIGSIWYFVLLGGIAIGFALLLPRGIWGTIVDRIGVRLLPVGYRLSVPAKISVASPEPAGQS